MLRKFALYGILFFLGHHAYSNVLHPAAKAGYKGSGKVARAAYHVVV